MKRLIIILLTTIITSCIPVKVAPRFKSEDYKIMQAKKFQRKLPRETAFIFKDPKDAEEFYHFINKKYNLNHNNVGYNVPFTMVNQTLYLSYYEIEKEDTTINLPLVLIDAKRESNGNSRLFENNYSSRKGYWYIIITVSDESMKNCLKDNHTLRNETIEYLKDLKSLYLSSQNYEELVLTKKS